MSNMLHLRSICLSTKCSRIALLGTGDGMTRVKATRVPELLQALL